MASAIQGYHRGSVETIDLIGSLFGYIPRDVASGISKARIGQCPSNPTLEEFATNNRLHPTIYWNWLMFSYSAKIRPPNTEEGK